MDIMTRNLKRAATIAATALLLSGSAAYAQNGRGVGGGIGVGGGVVGGVGAGGGGIGGSIGAGGGIRGNGGGIDTGIGGRAGVRTDMNLPTRANGNAVLRSGGDTRVSVLERNPRVGTALTTALSRRGITLTSGGLASACAGYNNLGSCLAAINVSHNLGIDASALRARTTGSGAISLGQAIHQLKPSVDANAAAKLAARQARAQIDAAARLNDDD
jgi:hypothetical protein